MAMRCGYRQSEQHVRRRMESKAVTLAKRAKPFKREWLFQKYIEEGLDCTQIGRIGKRDPKTIWFWLRYYNIATRPRGVNHTQLPKDGSSWLGRNHKPETRELMRKIALADGRVPFDPAVGPPMRGKHGPETINWKGGVTPERQAFYASMEWRDACCAVWARANALCERCELDSRTVNLKVEPFHVHHIVSFRVRKLRASVSNLALLCRQCHYFVHSKANSQMEFLAHAGDRAENHERLRRL